MNGSLVAKQACWPAQAAAKAAVGDAYTMCEEQVDEAGACLA